MIRIKKQFFQSVWITLFCNERFYGTAEENQQTQASLVPAYQPFHFSIDLLTVRQEIVIARVLLISLTAHGGAFVSSLVS